MESSSGDTAPAPASARSGRELGESVIVVDGLRKAYKSAEALRGVSFAVGRGEIFALLGPNGAGKTTTVEVLEGYRDYDAGRVEVLGVDPAHAGGGWRERIGIVPQRHGDAGSAHAWRDHLGIVLQTTQVEPELTVRESLEMFAGYFSTPRPIDATLELVGLASEGKRRSGKLSGGLQRRLDVALGLIGDPQLLFLDEPTTGFDPAARRQFWEVILSLRRLGTTVLLTTHYMEEAQALADRVAILVGGQIVAEGTPAELGGRELRASRITFQVPEEVDVSELRALLPELRVVGERVEIATHAPLRTLDVLVAWGRRHGLELPDLEVSRPRLEDVYLELTKEGR